MKKKIIIGLTGGFGTGKTTVARIFKKLGAVVIDADKIAHEIILPGGAVYKKVVSLFGRTIVKRNGRIDRKRLGRIVFNDRKRLLLLNSLIHPEVINRIEGIVKKRYAANKIFIIDAPLLIEAGLLELLDKLIVVTTERKTQIARCVKNFGISRKDVTKRIRSQMPLLKKRSLADFIIDNNGSLSAARRKVKKIWREIKDGTK